ncbi:proteasome lid subunit RPN8/RPN11/LysM repeat protein [Clostridium saccharoperbutylacetonicum]|uniref:Putative metal-dependent protease of the PAD1/JAB1 superfamily n=1 Tax=Clostridium saccharoperbutylacetonicum N1-4(HMT) TaxID=931276 RepID=M1MF94_9CLOT|nr:LysM peptidoglycan-binding domain-containing protein [Clostridium saccharoperbutylacetonicum]AGF56589.1 putative metal-dependent protease of the PAD1/JAB1 superfamily [Clostridium saccharoperbutylacetonicum N1-4(HMT)]NRT62660.1 proteasome lid subunit RPN8/RPN11/LysM repeat protein [Clostridium saccharoperbutylacetonicum]NSB26008.1 proteasome lid subunit RPN8/RPN11/LysM repeat protein [Clostridium saccharoperbutylacetonicum]NSB45366.1 proteasome lid subunit RPN8/RPN11/LysM repeat protein [Clo
MKEIEIVEDEKINASNETIKLPDNFITIGETDVNDVKIYIKQDVYNEIEKFSKADTTRERGGILIGDYAEVNNKKNVIISDFIEAKYTDATASTLTFTHETWNYIHNEHENLYPDKKILGWQHTHPSYGIFLSNYDIFIQENFFNLPWQIAYVVDPIAGTRGFFQWKNDKVEKTNSFYIFDDIGKKLEIKLDKSNKSKGKLSLFSLITFFILASVLVFTIFEGTEKINYEEKQNELLIANNQLTTEKDELTKKLQESKELIEKLQQAENTPKENKKTDEVDKDILKLKPYTIQAGDTLNEICKKHNLDYDKNKALVLKINGITNEDKIYVGEKLYLPLS